MKRYCFSLMRRGRRTWLARCDVLSQDPGEAAHLAHVAAEYKLPPETAARLERHVNDVADPDLRTGPQMAPPAQTETAILTPEETLVAALRSAKNWEGRSGRAGCVL